MFPETSFCLSASVSAKKGHAMGRAEERRANVWVGEGTWRHGS